MSVPSEGAVLHHEQVMHDCEELAHDEPKQVLQSLLQGANLEADPSNLMLFGLLMKIRPLLIQATEKSLSSSGLSWARLRFLVYLARQEQLGEDGALPSELSEMQGISRNTASALINGLEADGLITRQLHSSDRRKLVIRLTPKGREALQADLARHVRLVNRCFDALDTQERNTLFELLSRLEEGLKENASIETVPLGEVSTQQPSREERTRL